METSLIYLPVSLGEAIDKFTILDIKLDIIKDARKKDVQTEYDILYTKLQPFIEKYGDLYRTMKKVNKLIWDMMDILRDGNVNEEKYLKICKECIDYNDIRFRVKNKINFVSNSTLKEQKSYKINRLVLIINKNIDSDSTILLNIIKYFSYIYDEISIKNESTVEYLKTHFEYDNTIVFTGETLDYKCKVVIEDTEYVGSKIYDLFNITEFEINKII
jgi:hypothetical protein